jgi:asparagine synthase (glutamine-hydrolysing)
VACLTLVVPGSPDAELAARLTSRFGMRHHVLRLDTIGDLDPQEARLRAEAASRRLDAATDPLALAVLKEVEGELAAVPRLSGLGGEVVRGFYYVPAPLRGFGRDHRVSRLARWRMFPNEEVPDEVIHPRLREERRARAVADLQAIFAAYSEDWNAATDQFYLDQRMQRWAGVLASATSSERVVINPMLDPEFLALGTRLPTRWKANARFLSRILCELDPVLADIPLDGRPAPRSYAHPGWRDRVTFARLVGHKVVGKVGQRLTSAGRAPAGGVTLGDLVVEAWRADPALLAGARSLDVVDPAWLDGVLAGAAAPPSAVALLTNLGVAAEALGRSPV